MKINVKSMKKINHGEDVNRLQRERKKAQN